MKNSFKKDITPASKSDENFADYFINFYVLDHEGIRRKVFYVPLRNSNGYQKQLIEAILESPNDIDDILSCMTCTFQSGKPAAPVKVQFKRS